VYREQTYTVQYPGSSTKNLPEENKYTKIPNGAKQYPGSSTKNLPEENKYTKIPNGAKSKYRFITEQQEILESPKIPSAEP
jgi:hypothetical protein